MVVEVLNECIGTTNKGDQFMNYMDYVYDYNMVRLSNQQVIQGEAWALVISKMLVG